MTDILEFFQNTLHDPYNIIALANTDGSTVYNYTDKTTGVLVGSLSVSYVPPTIPNPPLASSWLEIRGYITTYGNTTTVSGNLPTNIQPIFSVYQSLARDAEKTIFYNRRTLDGTGP